MTQMDAQRLRNLVKMQKPNDGSRSLFESVMVPEVMACLRDWQAAGAGGVLIGGLALSFYVKPRMTQDVDVLMLSDSHIPSSVAGFKKTRGHAFQHDGTHVEVEIVTPSHVSIPLVWVDQVFKTARVSDGVSIASPSGLVVLKLARYSIQDQADIVALLKHESIDLTGFDLSQDRLDRVQALLAIAEAER